MLLIGDIGGTKTQLALLDLEAEGWEFAVQARYPSADFASLEDMAAHFLAEHDASATAGCSRASGRASLLLSRGGRRGGAAAGTRSPVSAAQSASGTIQKSRAWRR